MNGTAASASAGAGRGMKPWPAVATVIIGLALYLGLPLLVPVPSPQTFKGMAAAPKVAAVATPMAANPAPAAKAGQPDATAKAAADSGAKSQVVSRVPAGDNEKAAETKRRGDWEKGLHLLALFITTIVGIILKPLPMGAVAILGIALTAVSGTLPIGDALSGFSDVVIWLIVLAFFISRGFIKTGLGARIAYNFMALLGRRTLGLSYGLAATDLVLAPAIPSNTARAGGIVMPIMASLAREADGYLLKPVSPEAIEEKIALIKETWVAEN